MKTQPLTIHRPTKITDRYGSEVYGAPYTDTVVQGILGAANVREVTDGRQTVVTTVRAQLPPGTDITATDQLMSDKTYNVTGVAEITRPSGGAWFVSVDLEAAE